MARFFSGVYLQSSASREDLLLSLDQAIADGAESIWLLMTGNLAVSIEDIPEIARNLSVPLLATAMPGLVHDGEILTEGTMIFGCQRALDYHLIKDIDLGFDHIENQLAEIEVIHAGHGGALAVVDGLSQGIEPFIRRLYDFLGPQCPVYGGGAGYSDFRSAPCFADANGCYNNAAVLYFFPLPLALSARHGWGEVEGPFLVTEASGNYIHTLDYKPAFEVYRDTLQQHVAAPLDRKNILDQAINYPFGLRQFEGELLVRDPVRVEGQSLVCGGNIPPHSLVYILNAKTEQLLQAAQNATEKLVANLSPVYWDKAYADDPHHVFMFSCISRALYLREEFSEETKKIQQSLPVAARVVGCLSLGELASSRQGPVNFLNKTVVLGGLGC
jgi:hypothetical protein